MNCFNFELLSAFGSALKTVNFDPELRALIITGTAGPGKPAFSAGADLAERRTCRTTMSAGLSIPLIPPLPSWKTSTCPPSRPSTVSPSGAGSSWPWPATSGSPPPAR